MKRKTDQKTERSFLGTGWSFPPQFVKGENSVKMVSEEEDIQQSLFILLNTSCGERFLHPRFGCNLHDYLFETLDTGLKTYIEDLIRTAILNYESRITFLSADIVEIPKKNLLEITIEYIIRATNTRNNFVFPFYLSEGTELIK